MNFPSLASIIEEVQRKPEPVKERLPLTKKQIAACVKIIKPMIDQWVKEAKQMKLIK